MADTLLGERFDVRHAAGVTRYQVDRKHRDAGYYECVAIRGVDGTHHCIGAIQVFSRADILESLQDTCADCGSANLGAFVCSDCGASTLFTARHARGEVRS